MSDGGCRMCNVAKDGCRCGLVSEDAEVMGMGWQCSDGKREKDQGREVLEENGVLCEEMAGASHFFVCTRFTVTRRKNPGRDLLYASRATQEGIGTSLLLHLTSSDMCSGTYPVRGGTTSTRNGRILLRYIPSPTSVGADRRNTQGKRWK